MWKLLTGVFFLWALLTGRPGIQESASDPEPNTLADAPTLALPPGFEADVLYSPTAHDRGSWVSLAVDGRGRLIASDQYGKLYRMTPPSAPGEHLDSTDVVPLDVSIGRAQGLLWAWNSLYAVVNTHEAYEGRESGLYRIRDTDGDDAFDEVELLQSFEGAGEHGPHSLRLSPDGEHLYVMAGNHTDVPETFTSTLPMNWATDRLFPPIRDPRGHAHDRQAPGGWVARTDSLGQHWTIVGAGFRNSFDFDFNADGEMFTFDSDMEWDLGMPWYRPIRVLHVTSGSEFGWRTGSGKWPDYYPDSLPGVVSVGQGSPTGVLAGAELAFPAPYRDGLFVFDWSFGTMYFVELAPKGASYSGTVREFLSGVPLPLTDGVAGADGALYFATGGRNLDSYLYRVRYTGEAAPYPASRFQSSRALRHYLEAFHNRQDPAAVESVWPYLDHPHRFVRYAARIALEHQPIERWAERALAAPNPERRLYALLALARQGEPAMRDDVFESLLALDPGALTELQRLDLYRTYAVALTRMGAPGEAVRAEIVAELDRQLPSGSPQENTELAELLVYLEAPDVAARVLPLLGSEDGPEVTFISEDLTKRSEQYGPTVAAMLENMPPAHQIAYARSLARYEGDWSDGQRADYFAWLYDLLKKSGGESYAGFIDAIRQEAIERVPEGQRDAIAPYVGAVAEPVALADLPQPEGPGRTWNAGEAMEMIRDRERADEAYDYARGRRTYQAALCGACHVMQGEGGNAGPSLTQIGTRFSKNDIVRAITNPSATISDQYASTLLRLHGGGALAGRIVRESDGVIVLSTNPYDATQTVEVAVADVAERELSPVSSMPAGLLNRLNADEVRDLIAYLEAGGDPEHEVYTGEAEDEASE